MSMLAFSILARPMCAFAYVCALIVSVFDVSQPFYLPVC